MQAQELEARDALRYSWMTWPSTHAESTKCVVPLGSLYTPLKQLDDAFRVEYEPIRCKAKGCNAAINPYWYVEQTVSTRVRSSDASYLISLQRG